DLRREAELQLTDRIVVWAPGLPPAVQAHARTIATETLADEILTEAVPAGVPATTVALDGGAVSVGIRVAPNGVHPGGNSAAVRAACRRRPWRRWPAADYGWYGNRRDRWFTGHRRRGGGSTPLGDLLRHRRDRRCRRPDREGVGRRVVRRRRRLFD